MFPNPAIAEVSSGNNARPPFVIFSNSYAGLPERFFSRQTPTKVAGPRLVKLNHALAEELGLDLEAIEALGAAELFAGNLVLVGSEPLAMAYAGHQFGQFVPQLGDGRAILLGEVIDRNGDRRDIQLKGAGPTPFSRSGDGRAALGPVLREYLVSEAMNALGISTTRALAATTTGEIVYRNERLLGAVLTRVAASHVRVGTLQYFAASNDQEAVKRLADYVIDRHYSATNEAERPYLTLLESVVDRQASLIARWMHVGFIHGVMNTDNMAVSGETIDFGPCAFIDAYDPATVFSSIDRMGRYAYQNQPRIAQWNLARFAETLLPLIDADLDRAVELATEVVSGFSARYERNWLTGMRAKIGLRTAEEGDADLVRALLDALHKNAADFTLTFRRLGDAAASPDGDAAIRTLFADPADYDGWAARWRLRLEREPGAAKDRRAAMRRVNPSAIPRNHRVEAVIKAAIEGDFAPFHEMVDALSKPYADGSEDSKYCDPPPPDQRVYQTFCGT
jgi:uncharacterized protein YdiU (UPF0061 family)